MNLNWLLLFPLLTALGILASGGPRPARRVACLGALLQLALACLLAGLYLQQRHGGDTSPFLFETNLSWYGPLHIRYHLGLDGISLSMILLTALVTLSGVLVSWSQQELSREFFLLLTMLSLGAYGFFLSLDLFTQFFFLELAVIPKFMLIGIWGSGRKEYSAMKLALMLLGGSALIFVGLAGLYVASGQAGQPGLDLATLQGLGLPAATQRLLFPFLFVGFGIFTALFPFHTWVPDGHASAPTAASMFLAGISMKLGGYGCLRVAAFLLPEAARYYSPVILVLATIAILYGALATLMQTDLKYMNAYSSVSHCGFVLLGIGMLTRTAITGAMLQMVSHGLMTALFFAAIGMIYDRTHTRQVAALGGLLSVMPFISTVFVIAGLCSLGLPGLSGFAAEVTVFMGSWERAGNFYHGVTVLACASIVVTAVYILRATGTALLGPLREESYGRLADARWNERLASALLVAGILLVGLAPFWLVRLLDPATDLIMQKLAALPPVN
ncbi:MAG TPA: NADH-quinone oxidoreductase subunit M [Chitinophagaceae bacterium]|nr:NADH-quinone oxidoreductase subunit M [Chitinophagaceae bacterium]